MQLGWTILYVPDVMATLAFYETAFGLARAFVDPAGQYGEMATGATKLAFAAEPLAAANGADIRVNRLHDTAAGFEIALVSDDPDAAFARAIAAGATPVRPVELKPWGQKVGHVRDLNGCLVEICAPLPG